MAPVKKSPTDRFDDEHYPAYTTGRAAEMIGATPAFLRSIENTRLFAPARSHSGHRRYSRHQLRRAALAALSSSPGSASSVWSHDNLITAVSRLHAEVAVTVVLALLMPRRHCP